MIHPDGFYYVYILKSTRVPEAHYTGLTENLCKRLAKHNSGAVLHTAKSRPWRIETVVAFSDRLKAVAFEKYLESGSGRAFAKKKRL